VLSFLMFASPCAPLVLPGALSPHTLQKRAKENSLLFSDLHTLVYPELRRASLLEHQSEAHLLSCHTLPHSFAKTPGVALLSALKLSSFTLGRPSRVSPLKSALGHPTKDGHPEEPQLATKGPLLSRLESALTKMAPLTPLESALTKKPGGWGVLCQPV